MLASLLGWLLPGPLQDLLGVRSPLEHLRSSIRPNPYAPTVSRDVLGTAIVQAARPDVVVGIRGGLSHMSGSEADYGEGQHTPDILVQDVSAHALPPAMFVANMGKPPLRAAYHNRPVTIPGAVPWGRQQRGVPTIRNATLLPPLGRTPLPREMAASFATAQPNEQRLEDIFRDDG